MDYIKGGHNVYLLTYHIVFVTKYRKPVINEEISEFLKEHIAYLCGRFGAELLTAETDRDHIHLLVSMTPTTAPSDLIRVLKTQTSREIHQDERMDGHVKKYIYGKAPLWQPSYFIATTGTTVMEKVREYIVRIAAISSYFPCIAFGTDIIIPFFPFTYVSFCSCFCFSTFD